MSSAAELLEREAALLAERTRGSEALFRRARGTLAAGVSSSFHGREPWPIYIERGEGARVWDVDGNEYTDFHNGFSAMVQGHAHPAVRAAVERRLPLGTHFGATTEDAIAVAEELARRFGPPRWRFANSGTEANMAAVKLARAATGRDDVIVMQDSYHGHADIGSYEIPFNDAAALERALAELRPACVLTEGAMTSIGLVLPEPGYLDAVRELTSRHGALFVLDEVKTGLTIAPGGAVERLGARPDLLTLAKSLGGGLPTGALGMSAEIAALVEGGSVPLMGTFNGNPLSMAAARASLEEVLVPAAYERLESLGRRLARGCDELIERQGLRASCVTLASKGSLRLGQDPVLAELVWTWLMNRGLYTTHRREPEWNVTVAHDDEAVDAYLEALGALAGELSPRSSGSARA